MITMITESKQSGLQDDDQEPPEEPVATVKSEDAHLRKQSAFLESVVSTMDFDGASSRSSGSLFRAPSYVLQHDLVEMPNFLDDFGELPVIEDISEEAPLIFQKSIVEVPVALVGKSKDVGSFVDPLTGMVVFSEEEEEEAEEESMEEEGVEEDTLPSEDSEMLILLEMEKEEEPPKIIDEEEAFETFFELEAKKEVLLEEEIDWDEYEQQQMIRQIKNATLIFLKEIINNVVERCEYIDPKVLLRQHLDKLSLMREIDSKLTVLEMEQKIRIFLNRKVVDHYYRKGDVRRLMEDSPDDITDEIKKFREATASLDDMMGREEIITEATQEKIEQLQTELINAQARAQQKLHNMEELIKKTFAHEKLEKLQVTVGKELSNMSLLRDEISEVRYLLIQRQHSHALLFEKLNKLEDLGDGLRMHNFENLHTQTQALGKKIEERNGELNKLRLRCNADLHILAHIKEKQQMLLISIDIQKRALDHLQHERRGCRERVFELKIARGKMRKEINELSFQSGLLDKPALMLDYDATVDKVTDKNIVVEELRRHLAELDNKIKYLEAKCILNRSTTFK